MNREEYLYALYHCLYALSAEEKAAAMQYYTEYFDDAGPENEQQVISELGPPQEVAKQILKDFATDRYPFQAGRPGRDSGRGKTGWWMIIIGLIALPILLPVAITLLAILFGLALAAVIMVAVMVAVTIGLIAAGISGCFYGLFGLGGGSWLLAGGWSPLGNALLSLGLGLLLIPLCFWLLRSGLPALFQKAKLLLQGLRR